MTTGTTLGTSSTQPFHPSSRCLQN